MSDVARLAGVHPSTVSRALRNDRRIPGETCARIQKAVERLAYRPNPLVSALISNRRRRHASQSLTGANSPGGESLGCVLAFLTAWDRRGRWKSARQYAAVFDAMKNCAWKRGYIFEEFWLGEPGMTPDRLRQILLTRGIRGIVVCPLPGGKQELAFDFSSFASVALGYTLRSPALDHVAYDYCSVLKEAARRLVESGFSRIGFLTTNHTSNRVAHLSLGAFWAERHLVPRRFLPPLVTPGTPETTRAEVLEWVRLKRPDVIITPTQTECASLRLALEKTSIPVPGCVSVVCLDCHSNTQDSGMVRDTDAEARAVIDLLTSRVERGQEGIPVSPQTILIGGHWRDGLSLRN